MLKPDPILGAVVANFPSERARPTLATWFVCGIVIVTLSLITVLAGDAWWAFPLVTLGSGGVVVVGSWFLLNLWNREVILYERGFSFREGSKTIFIRYHEVTTVRLAAEQRAYFFGLLRRQLYQVRLTTEHDEVIVLDNTYRRIAELSERLDTTLRGLLRPKLAARIARGEQVTFAPGLALSADGLHHDALVLAWSAFRGWRVANRRLELLAEGGAVWHSVPLAEVDNLTLLVELLREKLSVPAV